MKQVNFKADNQNQAVLFPERLDEYIPQNSPMRLVNQVVDLLDLSEIISTYKSGEYVQSTMTKGLITNGDIDG